MDFDKTALTYPLWPKEPYTQKQKKNMLVHSPNDF